MGYITGSQPGAGLLFTGNFIVPFTDKFPDGRLYRLLTTKIDEVNLIKGEKAI